MNCIIALLLTTGCQTAQLNDTITGALNPITKTQDAISANVQKLRVPVSNTNAQINVIKTIPQNTKTTVKTWGF